LIGDSKKKKKKMNKIISNQESLLIQERFGYSVQNLDKIISCFENLANICNKTNSNFKKVELILMELEKTFDSLESKK
jgi:hypothetical protein